MSIYTHKLVDGVIVSLTPAEIQELEQRDLNWINNPPPLIPPPEAVPSTVKGA